MAKAWYMFLLHAILVVAIAVGTITIDGLVFNIGSPPNATSYHGRLYQTQVTAILSLALVILRTVSGSCFVFARLESRLHPPREARRLA